MKKIKWIFFLLLIFSFSSYGGKVENIKKLVQISCNKSIGRRVALRLVKKVYLTCIPDKKVNLLADCSVNCQKNNQGNIIGGQ